MSTAARVPHLTRLRRRIALWLAVLMAVSGGMASGLSHGALRTDPSAPWLAEICTAPVASAGTDDTSKAAAEPRGQDNSAHLLAHCPLCLLGSHAFGPPPAPALWRPLSQAAAEQAPRPQTSQHEAVPTWRALPRGPPARDWL